MSQPMIGVCDFPYDRERYQEEFNIVEHRVGLTSAPSAKTLRKWASSSPEGFEHVWVASQWFTHEAKEIRKGRKLELSEGETLKDSGHFKDTPLNRRLWGEILENAIALGAKRILLETPASFVPSPRNKARLNDFVKTWSALPEEIQLVWAPSGFWSVEELDAISNDLGIQIAVDPLIDLEEAIPGEAPYFRLLGSHGLRGSYDDERLEILAELCEAHGPSAVIFRTESSMRDAKRLRALFGDIAT